MTTFEMLKSLVGKKFDYSGNVYELIQLEPTVILQNMNDDTHIQMPIETFKRRLLDGAIGQVGAEQRRY